MKHMDTRKIFETRATLQPGQAAVENDCERCGDPLIFAMQDRQHQFSLGLVTVLQCLRVAEQEGFVPALPPEWWWAVESRYNQLE